MKSSFDHRLVNGPFEDTVLYVRLKREKRALMFDCGEISSLAPGELLKVTDLFITHTHIDHFIGFDRLLRAILIRKEPLNVYGPESITDRIEGKLRGYTWDLIRNYPVEIYVNAISGDRIARSVFRASNEFRKQQLEEEALNNGTVLEEPSFKVRTTELKHRVPCMAYALEENFHINIIETELNDMGLTVGPWLSGLKQAIHQDSPGSTMIETGSGLMRLDELKPIVKITRGQKISFITDIAPTKENIERAVALAMGSDTLYLEAVFMSSERERAIERNHLSALDTAEIARKSGAGRLVSMHYSSRYKDRDRSPGDEAQELSRPS